MSFLDHNLPITNARKPIKGSKYAGFCLFYFTSNKQRNHYLYFFLRPPWRHQTIPWPLPTFSL